MTPPENDPAFDAPDDLIDGHTTQELSDYFAAGRTPRDPGIENSPGCRLYLAALGRLQSRSWAALELEAENEPDRDDAWIAGLLETIRTEVRTGRDIPVSDPDPTLRLTVSESAVQGIIRHAADSLDGVIIGRCTLDGDVTLPRARITVTITAAARYGERVDVLAEELRARIRSALELHTELVVDAIDITFDDVYLGSADEATR